MIDRLIKTSLFWVQAWWWLKALTITPFCRITLLICICWPILKCQSYVLMINIVVQFVASSWNTCFNFGHCNCNWIIKVTIDLPNSFQFSKFFIYFLGQKKLKNCQLSMENLTKTYSNNLIIISEEVWSGRDLIWREIINVKEKFFTDS